jgi:hypothetical protein
LLSLLPVCHQLKKHICHMFLLPWCLAQAHRPRNHGPSCLNHESKQILPPLSCSLRYFGHSYTKVTYMVQRSLSSISRTFCHHNLELFPH